MAPLCTGRKKTGGHSEENPDLLYVLEGQKTEIYLASSSWLEPQTHGVRELDGRRLSNSRRVLSLSLPVTHSFFIVRSIERQWLQECDEFEKGHC